MLPTSKRKILIICPHFDDACFSMSGLLLKEKFQQITILTIFTKSIHAPHSKILYPITRIINFLKVPFLTELTADMVSKRRQKEDRQFCDNIGAIQATLTFEDSSLRCPIGTIRTNKQDTEKESIDDRVYKALEKIVLSDNYDLILCPLAVGDQIDHLVIMKALLQIFRSKKNFSTKVLFYEDLPYSSNYTMEAIYKVAMERTGSSDPIYVNITYEMPSKKNLCEIYHTQSTMFAKEKIFYHNKRLYASSHPRNIAVGYSERFWRYSDR
jgi:LmbE family N-acetylglucosaminyl deacetylase